MIERHGTGLAAAIREDDLSWLMNAAEGGHDNIISCGMARRIVSALDPDALQLAEEPKRETRDSVESIVQTYATAHRAALAAAPQSAAGSESNQPDELSQLEREIADSSAGWILQDSVVMGSAMKWCDLTRADHALIRAARYLELRGLLERHPDNPNLVRIKERCDE